MGGREFGKRSVTIFGSIVGGCHGCARCWRVEVLDGAVVGSGGARPDGGSEVPDGGGGVPDSGGEVPDSGVAIWWRYQSTRRTGRGRCQTGKWRCRTVEELESGSIGRVRRVRAMFTTRVRKDVGCMSHGGVTGRGIGILQVKYGSHLPVE